MDERAIPADDSEALFHWLAISWRPIQAVLTAWTVNDLIETYPHRYDGQVYSVLAAVDAVADSASSQEPEARQSVDG